MMNKKYITPLLILFTAIITALLTYMITDFIGTEGKEPIPKEILFKKISPNGKLEALIFAGDTGESWDLLGAGHRAYLAIVKNNTTMIINRDLTEGMGTYEGGIMNIEWLNNEEILIERYISDRQDNIVYNCDKIEWKSQKSK